MLEGAAAQLEIAGDRRGVLDEPVVHQRRTHLQRVRHRHPVGDRQQVVGHPGHQVGVEHAVDEVLGGFGVEEAQDLADRVAVGEPRLRRRVKSRCLLSSVKRRKLMLRA